MLLACAALALATATGGVAWADAAPVDVLLGQLNGLTSAKLGQRATGLAEVVLPEGEARVAASGLAQLDGSQRYVAWLLNQQTGETYKLGALASEAGLTGAERLDAVMQDAIPDDGWDTVLITIEDGTDAAQPSGQHVIAGSFPTNDQLAMPNVLPNTGGDPDPAAVAAEDQPTPATGLAALLLGAGAILGFGAGRLSTRVRR